VGKQGGGDCGTTEDNVTFPTHPITNLTLSPLVNALEEQPW